MKTEERVQTYTSDVEPTTGDKRQRDDDHGPNPHPSSRSSGSGQAMGNGAFIQGTTGMAMIQPGGVGGYDALYIGDLQWVRYFVVYHHVDVLKLFLFVTLVSGQRMRIFDKSRSTVASILTTMILHFLSIKLTARARGEFLHAWALSNVI